LKEKLALKPSKVIALGLNYGDHAREFNLDVPEEPIIFMNPRRLRGGAGDSHRQGGKECCRLRRF